MIFGGEDDGIDGRDLNTAVETFPGNLVAGTFGVGKRQYFELGSDAERAAPRVTFGG